MATTNIWKRFSSLLPRHSRSVVNILSNNGNGTSTVQLRDGSIAIVNGETVPAGNRAIVEHGDVKTMTPDLPFFRRSV